MILKCIYIKAILSCVCWYLLDGLLLCVVAGPEVDTQGVDDQLAVVRVRDVVNLPAVRSE